ncbi:hypothetical protein QF046_002364 [Microbacterium sp. W4I4]|uniref:DUF2188 domain-containing protein n=1 Tax=Microbacterium sp. W4I4 TaxID=3042295 RepID=UPI00278692A5|nr:DUF2188 domain-containing protein [Microbacterium sp. W4I4]MDQ0614723.1 hypothetical protein [Microbacterium sp. W4I4]
MTRGDVETLSKHGQWVNRVEGEEELSQGYASKEEAIEEGRRLAEATGSMHTVRDAQPTGVVTDEQDPERMARERRSGSDGDADGADDVIAVEDLP